MSAERCCPRCLEPLGKLVSTVEGTDFCAVCGAAEIAQKSNLDVDLAQGLAATLLGQGRGSAFLSSFIARKSAEASGAPPPLPMDPMVARVLGFAHELVGAARMSKRKPKRVRLKKKGRKRNP